MELQGPMSVPAKTQRVPMALCGKHPLLALVGLVVLAQLVLMREMFSFGGDHTTIPIHVQNSAGTRGAALQGLNSATWPRTHQQARDLPPATTQWAEDPLPGVHMVRPCAWCPWDYLVRGHHPVAACGLPRGCVCRCGLFYHSGSPFAEWSPWLGPCDWPPPQVYMYANGSDPGIALKKQQYGGVGGGAWGPRGLWAAHPFPWPATVGAEITKRLAPVGTERPRHRAPVAVGRGGRVPTPVSFGCHCRGLGLSLNAARGFRSLWG
jgi:hypothetical protein